GATGSGRSVLGGGFGGGEGFGAKTQRSGWYLCVGELVLQCFLLRRDAFGGCFGGCRHEFGAAVRACLHCLGGGGDQCRGRQGGEGTGKFSGTPAARGVGCVRVVHLTKSGFES